MPTASAATAPTPIIEEMDPEAARAAKPKSTFAIDSLDLVEGTYKLDVAVHKRDGCAVRLPPPAVHVPREVADARRRHLPAAAPLGVFVRRDFAVQEAPT